MINESLPLKYNIYEKKGKLYVVISYKEDGVTKRKWLPTGLNANTKKKDQYAVADKIAADFYKEKFLSTLETTAEKTETSTENTVTDKAGTNNSASGEQVQKSKADTNSEYEFTNFVSKWFDSIKPTISVNTFKTYKSIVKATMAYFKDKNLYINTIKPLDIQEYYSMLHEKGLKGTTVKRYHVIIHKTLEYAVTNEIIPYNPSDRVERPKLKRYEAAFYSKEELNKLFEVFKGDRMELVVYIGAYYGLRRCEILGLKWSAIDFEKKTLSVNGKLVSVYENGKEKAVFESDLKTVATLRTLPLIPQIEKKLLEQKEKLENYKKLLGKQFDTANEEFICCDNFGKLITPEYTTIHFGYMVRTRGLRHLRFHDLRHSCASLLLANGVPMKAIQDWLGHASFNVTANYYSHLDYSSKLASAETISKIFDDDNDEDGKKNKPDRL